MYLRKFFYPILLLLICLILAFKNYTPGTFLSGWDTSHPEFNLPLAFQRTFNGVWRADQGLGAVAGHSHMAELPRLIVLALDSIIVPLPLIRYLFFFFSVIGGVLGTYVLVNAMNCCGLKPAVSFETKGSSIPLRFAPGCRSSPLLKARSFLDREIKKNHAIAFIAALIYLANLGTVQIFSVPFEMFAVAYAMLPWLVLAAKNYVETGKRKPFLLFCLTVILAAPMAYAATLWYAVFLCVGISFLLFPQKKRAIALLITTLILNLYWILPNIYTSIYHGVEIENSKINRLFSPEVFAKNQEFGTIKDVPLIKNFLFDWQVFNYQTHEFEEVLKPWQTYLRNPFVGAIGYGTFVIAFIGMLNALRTRNRMNLAMLPLFFIPFVFLLNGTWPVSDAFDVLGRVNPTVKEALRVPFTKFSIPFMLAIAFYAGEGIDTLIFYSSSILMRSSRFVRTISNTIVIIVSVLLLVYFLPAFQGNLIHPAMRISIPNAYFQMFDWFKTQDPHGRVAELPIHTFWGWTYYTWDLPAEASAKAGYQGAGFLQFGIPQPIMDRDYNRWSRYNELYQREMSYAVYSQNSQIIAKVLQKYRIKWILLDRSVFAPGNADNTLLTWHIPSLLEETGIAHVTKQFGTNITVYMVDQTPEQKITILPDVTNSDHFTGQTDELVTTISGKTYEQTSGSEYDHFSLPALTHDQAYAVTIQSRNEQGFPLQLCISNDLTGHCDVYTYLEKGPGLHKETFLLPPLNDFGMGYTININNYAINGQTAKNRIDSINVFKVQTTEATSQPLDPHIITNNQAFEVGWMAWDGTRILPHIKVNGWENAWIKEINKSTNDKSTNMLIFFLPQLLEWIGFLLLPLPFLAAIVYDKGVWQKLLHNLRQRPRHRLRRP